MRGRPGTVCTALAALVPAVGCAVGPNYVPPEPETPDAWELELTRGLREGQASLQTWWTVFEDPLLTSLVDRSVQGNLDLRLALERVAEARAQRGFARGSWFPSIFNFATYNRGQLSEELFVGLPQAGDASNLYQYGFDATWEIDVFGRVRRSVEASNAALEATIEAYRDTLVVLLAEVALSYVDLRTAQERLRYTRDNVRLQRGTLQLTQDRNRAGLAPDLDVRQAELNLAQTESNIPRFEQAIRFAINRIGVLLGESPGAIAAELTPAQPIPRPPDEVIVGLPAELLRQRPDLRSAERRLAAQTAEIGVATADLYPRFALLGSFSFDALKASKVFTGDATAFSVGPAMRWNLFDGGRVRANIALEEERARQALTRYENTLLLALEESENAMVAFQREQERREALERSVVAAQESVKLVNVLYRTGLTDFQNVLDMERSLARQQDFLAESEGLVSADLIRIYKALGGGWTP
jgi:NodT family efflux transporter outer membrane factor (OMF) lipoprotein